MAEGLPDSFRAEYPNVAWSEIRGMRNLVAHHYHRVLHTAAEASGGRGQPQGRNRNPRGAPTLR